MADELVDVFDENYVMQGQCMKSIAHKYGLWVHSFHCWLFSPTKRTVLFQLRAPNKKLFPDALDISAAGHLQSGEAVEDGVREIEEELGIDVDFEDLISLGIKHDLANLPGIVNRQFCHVFLYSWDLEVADLKMDSEEVYGILEINIDDGLQLFSNKIKEASAHGIFYEEKTNEWKPVVKTVSLASFIPRVDNYYLKIMMLADLKIQGYPYLTI